MVTEANEPNTGCVTNAGAHQARQGGGLNKAWAAQRVKAVQDEGGGGRESGEREEKGFKTNAVAPMRSVTGRVPRGRHASPAWRCAYASEEVLLMWSLRDPFAHRGGQLAEQDAQECHVEVAGQRLEIHQDPGMLRLPGVTGSVLWDSGCALARVLELCCQNGWLSLPV